MKNSMEVPQKIKIELSYDPAIPLLVYIQKKWKQGMEKMTALPFYCSITHNSQDVEKTYVHKWMDKADVKYTHTHVKYYSAIKEKETLPFGTPWMNPEGFMLKEVSDRKENYYIISFTVGPYMGLNCADPLKDFFSRVNTVGLYHPWLAEFASGKPRTLSTVSYMQKSDWAEGHPPNPCFVQESTVYVESKKAKLKETKREWCQPEAGSPGNREMLEKQLPHVSEDK